MTEEKEPAMPSPPLQWKFDLLGATPTVDVSGGTIREANASSFPALQGNGLGVYLLDLEPGAIRIRIGIRTPMRSTTCFRAGAK